MPALLAEQRREDVWLETAIAWEIANKESRSELPVRPIEMPGEEEGGGRASSFHAGDL